MGRVARGWEEAWARHARDLALLLQHLQRSANEILWQALYFCSTVRVTEPFDRAIMSENHRQRIKLVGFSRCAGMDAGLMRV